MSLPSAPPVGLIPAAGRGERLGRREGSKEMLAVPGDAGERPVSRHLLEGMALAGVETAYVLLRAGKWDIPEHYLEGGGGLPRLAYLVTPGTASVAETLDLARPFVAARRVAMGFPDILYRPHDALARLLERQGRRGAEVVLGLFPSDRPDKADLVETDEDGAVRRIQIKPGTSSLELTWILAVWTPAFTEFLGGLLAGDPGVPGNRELYPSDVLNTALEAGLQVDSVRFPRGRYLDVGTRDDLARARRGWAQSPSGGPPTS